MKFQLISIFLVLSLFSFNSFAKLAQLRKEFKTNEWVYDKGLCNGFKSIVVPNIKSKLCVGVVTTDLKFPRYIASLKDDIYIIDKGSDLFDRDNLGKGRLLKLTFDKKNKPIIKVMAKGLKSPSGLALWTNSKGSSFAFITVLGEVVKLNLSDPSAKPKTVVGGLPYLGWHYVSSLEIYKNLLYVNVGSKTDHCENRLSKIGDCLEKGTSAHIRQYKINPDSSVSKKIKVFGHGLRNSMAMAVNPRTGELWQGENSWDDIPLKKYGLSDKLFPPDEINIIKADGHYGWPYCVGKTFKTPGYNKKCSKFISPLLELPSHSAPLDFQFYNSNILNNKLGDFGLLITLHGFRKFGQKIVYYQNKKIQTLVDLNQQKINKLGNKGRPVAMTFWKNSILVTDDWNHSLLIIANKN